MVIVDEGSEHDDAAVGRRRAGKHVRAFSEGPVIIELIKILIHNRVANLLYVRGPGWPSLLAFTRYLLLVNEYTLHYLAQSHTQPCQELDHKFSL